MDDDGWMPEHGYTISSPVSLRLTGELISWDVLHQSFVSMAPLGPGNREVFNFSVFKALLKARHCWVRFVVKSLLKAPAQHRLTIVWNNMQLGVVLMKTCERGT